MFLANLLAFPLLAATIANQGFLLLFAWYGVAAAEVGLVASWSVFGGGTAIRRLVLSGVIGAVLYAAFAIGLLQSATAGINATELPSVLALFFCASPLVFLAVQAPLWASRYWLGWTITDRRQGGSCGVLRIKDLALAVVAVSIALTLARLGPWFLPGDSQNEPAAMLFLAAFAGTAGVASLFSLPPLLFATLGVQAAPRGVTYAGAWFAVTTIGLGTAFFRFTGTVTAYQVVGTMTGTFAVLFCTVLFQLRSGGYRLLRRGSLSSDPGQRSGDR